MSTATSVSRSILVRGLVGLALLAGVAGCGPAPPDVTSTPTPPTAAVGGPHAPSPEGSQGLPVAQTPPSGSPVLMTEQRPDARDEPAPWPEYLDVPAWIAAALDHRDVRIRLKALDRWAQQGPNAPLDPLVVALDDEVESVRDRAMAIIEQQWAVERQSSDQ